jgi:putative transport protein
LPHSFNPNSSGIFGCPGIFAALLPPFIAWLIGLYFFKMDPIILCGAVAGARSSTTAMRAKPAFGCPVPYALSAVIVLIYGYLAMMLS